MENFKKALSVTLCAAIALGTCSCSKQFGGDVADLADTLGKNIVARDYKKIMKLSDEKEDEDLEAILSLSTDSGEEQNTVRELIADTLEYEVDEDSFEGDFMGKEGSIDVTFSYVDYEAAFDGCDLFEDLDQVTALLDDCDDRVEEKITFDFEKDGSDIICTNVGDIEKLFPYADEEFNFALERSEYAGTITFSGEGYTASTNTYLDATTIYCSLPIEGDGQNLIWDYSVSVTSNGSEICCTELCSEENPTELVFSYTYDGSQSTFPDGTYTVDFVLSDGTLIATADFYAENTVVTPSPTPEAASGSGTSTDGSIGSQYICPSETSVQLPDTDIIYTCPDGLSYCEPDSTQVQNAVDSGLADTLVIYCTGNSYSLDQVFIAKYGDFAYDSSVGQIYSDAAINAQIAQLEEEGTEYTLETSEMTVGGRTYTSTLLTYQVYGIDVYYSFTLIGDEDTCYMLCTVSSSAESRDNLMNCLSVAE